MPNKQSPAQKESLPLYLFPSVIYLFLGAAYIISNSINDSGLKAFSGHLPVYLCLLLW